MLASMIVYFIGMNLKINKNILIFSDNVRPFKRVYDALLKNDFDMARWYVLNNCEEVEPFSEESLFIYLFIYIHILLFLVTYV